MLKSRSKASLAGGVEALELSSSLSGVSGGVAKSMEEVDCLGMSWGETAVRKGESGEHKCDSIGLQGGEGEN